MTATTTTTLVPIQSVFSDAERLALAGFLAGYRGLAREAYALDRNELGALLVAAGLGPPAEHALMSLLALNGLRVSEATGADIEHLGLTAGTVLSRSHARAERWSPSRSRRVRPGRSTWPSASAPAGRYSKPRTAGG